MSNALIQIVDENDQPVRAATKQEAWDKGLMHRITRLMAEDKDGRILLQKRTAKMQLYPNCWDHSASGHVDAGEDYETAAHRELAEELGLKHAKLQVMGTYESHEIYEGRKLNRFNKVYRLELDPQTPLHPSPDEVAGLQWFTRAELQRLVTDHPEQVTDGLRQVVERFY